jgi:(1->4)-alpha-D-glucan 1-alpha-D-glucosylmutase
MTSPGLPDVYQGTEFWDLSFVDPDNRRAVDYAERRRCLEQLRSAEAQDEMGLLADLLSSWPDGRIKLYLVHKLLDFRREHHELFAEAEYLPLDITGESRNAVCAFARRKDRAWVVAVAPRLVGSAVFRGILPVGDEFWHSTAVSFDTEMPGKWLNVITGERFEVADFGSSQTLPLSRLLRNFPVALLYRDKVSAQSRVLEENRHAAGVPHST